MKVETNIIKVKGDWMEVVDDCRSTVGLEELGRGPSDQFKRDILISEHSPIRDIIVKWKWREIPYSVAMHWARHKWEKFIRTQRTDRTGIDRGGLSQNEDVSFTGEANIQHLIDTWRKRLCTMAASETRAYAEDFKLELMREPGLEFIGEILVPNCIYRFGCPEFKTCGVYSSFLRWCKEEGIDPTSSIRERYDAYNRYFRELPRRAL